MIVVDVNVVAYLLIEGPETPAVEELFIRDPEWAAPLLWRSEWRSVLSGYMRRGDVALPTALEYLAAAEELVRDREHLVDGSQVLSLAERSPCSAYDCEYVALAEALDVPLATYDKQLLRAFPERAMRPG